MDTRCTAGHSCLAEGLWGNIHLLPGSCPSTSSPPISLIMCHSLEATLCSAVFHRVTPHVCVTLWLSWLAPSSSGSLPWLSLPSPDCLPFFSVPTQAAGTMVIFSPEESSLPCCDSSPLPLESGDCGLTHPGHRSEPFHKWLRKCLLLD